MSENLYSSKVQSMRIFWQALQSWVKTLIFWVGLLIGALVWFAVLSAAFPLIALLFLGTGTPALILKVFVCVVIIVFLVITVRFAIWLLRLVVYGVCRIIFANNDSDSAGEHIFKKEVEA